MQYIIKPYNLSMFDSLVYDIIYKTIRDFESMSSSITYDQICEEIRRGLGIEVNKKKVMKSVKLLLDEGYLELKIKGKKGVSSVYEVKRIGNLLETNNTSNCNSLTNEEKQIGNKKGTTNKEIKNINNIYKDLIESYTENNDLKEAIKDFVSMRKSIKKPLTERALKTILNKLDKFAGSDASKIEILEASIEKNWLTVYEQKEKANYGKSANKNTLNNNISNNNENITVIGRKIIDI